jgi:hypothetical protein
MTSVNCRGASMHQHGDVGAAERLLGDVTCPRGESIHSGSVCNRLQPCPRRRGDSESGLKAPQHCCVGLGLGSARLDLPNSAINNTPV